MKLLSLDLSTANSGYAIFEDGKLTKFGSFPEPKYQGKSKDRYPQRTGRVGILMANLIFDLIQAENPDQIVIEEVSLGHSQGIKSVKGLIMLHGMVLLLAQEFLDKIKFIPCSGKNGEIPGWRNIINLKKGTDYKISSVKMSNQIFGLSLKNDEHDTSDAILVGYAYLKWIEDGK